MQGLAAVPVRVKVKESCRLERRKAKPAGEVKNERWEICSLFSYWAQRTRVQRWPKTNTRIIRSVTKSDGRTNNARHTTVTIRRVLDHWRNTWRRARSTVNKNGQTKAPAAQISSTRVRFGKGRSNTRCIKNHRAKSDPKPVAEIAKYH